MLSVGPYSYNRFDLFEKKSKPDFLDMDKDGDEKESFKKAIKDKKDGKKSCGCKKDTDCDCADKKDVKEGVQGQDSDYRKERAAERAKGKGSRTGKKDGDQYATGAEMGLNKQKVAKDIASKPDPNGGMTREEVEITKEDVIAHLIENNYANNEVSAEVLFTHISDQFLEEIESNISEGYMPLPKAKMANQANKAYGKEQQAVKAGDQAGANKQMQRRIAMTDPKGRKAVIGK